LADQLMTGNGGGVERPAEEPLVHEGHGRDCPGLLDPADRAPALVTADIPRRAAVFADAYGLDDDLRGRLVPFAAGMIRRFHRSARAAADRDPVFRRMWEGVVDSMPRAEAWIDAAGPAIAAALARPGRPADARSRD
jgi:hypothetical protein